MDGALLVYAGDSHKEAQVTGAIASNVWGAYNSHTETADTGGLEQIMMDCEEGRYVGSTYRHVQQHHGHVCGNTGCILAASFSTNDTNGTVVVVQAERRRPSSANTSTYPPTFYCGLYLLT